MFPITQFLANLFDAIAPFSRNICRFDVPVYPMPSNCWYALHRFLLEPDLNPTSVWCHLWWFHTIAEHFLVAIQAICRRRWFCKENGNKLAKLLPKLKIEKCENRFRCVFTFWREDRAAWHTVQIVRTNFDSYQNRIEMRRPLKISYSLSCCR